MGAEAKCKARYNRAVAEGTAQLETNFVQFRGGDLRLKLLFKDLKSVSAAKGVLTLDTTDGPLNLELGPQAEKWASKILNPPSRLEKLGVKPGMEIALEGTFPEDFEKELVSTQRTRKSADIIFLASPTRAALSRIESLKERLKPAGALWVIYPKGAKSQIGEMEVLSAGREAALKDVKVCSFSETLTGLKFVIPLAHRKQ